MPRSMHLCLAAVCLIDRSTKLLNSIASHGNILRQGHLSSAHSFTPQQMPRLTLPESPRFALGLPGRWPCPGRWPARSSVSPTPVPPRAPQSLRSSCRFLPALALRMITRRSGFRLCAHSRHPRLRRRPGTGPPARTGCRERYTGGSLFSSLEAPLGSH